MKTNKKALLTVLCALLLVVASVMGTMAYLTSTASVTNSFSVGKVNITLDEAPVDVNGVLIAGDRRAANEYKLMPGHEYKKDPTVHVTAGSEESWLFVKVTNPIADLEAEGDGTIAAQMAAKGWTLLKEDEGVYVYNKKVVGGDNVVVFESFKLKNNATIPAEVADLVVVACAVQADGLDTAELALAQAKFTNS